MKGSRLYMMMLLAFIVLVFIFEYMSPHKFSWNPTYDKNDKEPFGSYVFDDIMSSSVDNYSVANKTFYQILNEDSTISQHAFLLTEGRLQFTETDIEYLYRLIHLGNQIMICTGNFPYNLEDTLRFEVGYGEYFPSFIKYVSETPVRDSIFFGTDTLNYEQLYEVYPQMHPVSLVTGKTKVYEFMPINCDSMEVLVCNNKNEPLVIRAFIGKGEIFLVSTPLMFTNYGMLDRSNASYAFRLLSYMKSKPLMRIEAYGDHNKNNKTPLRYILSEPPLRWAIYFAMALLLSFMFFAAKRRQRVIPVVNTPSNRSIEFMQLISNLYYQKHNNTEILKMKYNYFCAEVKNLTGVDLRENIPTESDYRRLTEKTGLEIDFIRDLMKNIQMSFYRSEVSDIELKQYINDMNKILKQLTVDNIP